MGSRRTVVRGDNLVSVSHRGRHRGDEQVGNSNNGTVSLHSFLAHSNVRLICLQESNSIFCHRSDHFADSCFLDFSLSGQKNCAERTGNVCHPSSFTYIAQPKFRQCALILWLCGTRHIPQHFSPTLVHMHTHTE